MNDGELFTLDVSQNSAFPFFIEANDDSQMLIRLFRHKDVARAAIVALNRSVTRLLRSYRLRDDHLTKQEAIDNMQT